MAEFVVLHSQTEIYAPANMLPLISRGPCSVGCSRTVSSGSPVTW